jgi:hypothetical protein
MKKYLISVRSWHGGKSPAPGIEPVNNKSPVTGFFQATTGDRITAGTNTTTGAKVAHGRKNAAVRVDKEATPTKVVRVAES